MIKVFGHNLLDIVAPILFKIQRIIMVTLAFIPDVKQLVHNKHANFVTRFKQIIGRRIMSRPNSIKTGGLKLSNTPQFSIFQADCTNRPVIMMDAGATQLDRLSIDA